MSNYTPLDISLLLRGRRHLSKNGRDGFDRVFFPFTIVVLIMSLSFYAVRLIIEITGSTASPTIPMPTQAPQQTVQEFTKSAITTIPVPQVYHDVNGILVDAERVIATAEAQYPDLSRVQLVERVNKSLVQWAALRQYYKDNPNIIDRLSLDTTQPIATFGAVLRDVGILVTEYDKEVDTGKTSIDSLIELYTANSKIR